MPTFKQVGHFHFLLFFLLNTACSSLLNPHIKTKNWSEITASPKNPQFEKKKEDLLTQQWEKIISTAETKQVKEITESVEELKNLSKKMDLIEGPDTEYGGPIEQAVEYASETRQKFYEAVSSHSKLRSGMALTLMPLSAAAIGLGITGDSSNDLITGMALGGATLLAGGRYFESKPRQRVYLAGSEAIGCILLGNYPFILPNSELKKFNLGLNDIEKNINDIEGSDIGSLIMVENQIHHVYEAANNAEKEISLSYAKHLTDIEQFIVVVKQNVVRARTAKDIGEETSAKLDKAAFLIWSQTNSIINQVNQQVLDTEPSIDSIMSLTSGLRDGVTEFKKIMEPVEVKDPVEKDSGTRNTESGGIKPDLTDQEIVFNKAKEDLKKYAEVLKVHNNRLVKTTKKISRLVNKIASAENKVKDIGSCRVAQIDLGLKIQPSEETVHLVAGDNYSVAISNGKLPYDVQFFGKSPPEGALEDIEIKRNGNLQTFSVEIKKADLLKDQQQFSVLVTDATGEPDKGKMVTFIFNKPLKDKPATAKQATSNKSPVKTPVPLAEPNYKPGSDLGEHINNVLKDETQGIVLLIGPIHSETKGEDKETLQISEKGIGFTNSIYDQLSKAFPAAVGNNEIGKKVKAYLEPSCLAAHTVQFSGKGDIEQYDFYQGNVDPANKCEPKLTPDDFSKTLDKAGLGVETLQPRFPINKDELNLDFRVYLVVGQEKMLKPELKDGLGLSDKTVKNIEGAFTKLHKVFAVTFKKIDSEGSNKKIEIDPTIISFDFNME